MSMDDEYSFLSELCDKENSWIYYKFWIKQTKLYFSIIFFHNVCFFYAVKSICSFDPLRIASDYSNISENLWVVRKFYKNPPRIFKKWFWGISHHFTKSGIFHILSIEALSKKLGVHLISTKPCDNLLSTLSQK